LKIGKKYDASRKNAWIFAETTEIIQ
jgi:hypothetical protein